jgi:RNA-directed DNA polymerase
MQKKKETKTQTRFSFYFFNNLRKTNYQPIWNFLFWCNIENHVLRFQIEIYYASICHDYLKMKWLQKKLIHTIQAKLIASRCALIDMKQRENSFFLTRKNDVVCVSLALTLFFKNKKKNYSLTQEKAKHILVKLALEPEWEARFSQNSITLRTGRTVYDGLSTVLKNFENSFYYVLDGYLSHNLPITLESKICTNVWFRKIDTFSRLKKEIQKWLDKKN